MTDNNDAVRPGIIVLGLPRSGTTLVRRILNAHPSIACGGETFLLRATARFLQGDTIVDGIDYGVVGGLASAGFTRDEVLARLRDFAFSFFEEIAANSNKQRWASKTAVDSFYLREIEELYADHAEFVCVLRNGLDTVCSIEELCAVNEVYISELHSYVTRHPRPLEAFAYAWRDVTDGLLEFASRYRDRAHVVRYEDLVTDPETNARKMFEFLGEKMDNGLLGRALAGDAAGGLGDWKTHGRPTIDTTSVGRSSELREDVVSRLASILNPTLEKAGYEPAPVGALPDHDAAMRRYDLLMRFNAARSKSDSDES